MKDDIYFLFDTLQDKSVKELKDIGELMEHPEADKNSIILDAFARACIDVFKDKRKVDYKIKRSVETLIPREKRKYHYDVDQGLQVEGMKPSVHKKDFLVPKKNQFIRTKKGRLEVKKKEVKVEPVNIKKELKKVKKSEEVSLIIDKRTNKVLVGARVEDDRYIVIEPEMGNKDWILLSALIDKIKGKKGLMQDVGKLDVLLKQLSKKFNADYSDNLFVKLRYYLIRDLEKLMNLEPLLHDHRVSEIICEGYGVPVRVKLNGKVMESNVMFRSKGELDGFIKHVGESFGHDVSKEKDFDVVVYEFMMHVNAGEKAGFSMERID